MTCILGIDPGSRVTGFGVIEHQHRQSRYVISGCIRLQQSALPPRLHEIFRQVTQLVHTHQPDVLAIEQVFVSRNAGSALKLGQARGAAIVACAAQGLTVYEYAPNQIKLAVVGKGHADKTQMQHMICVLLNLPETPPADAADALSVALCHAHHNDYQNHLQRFGQHS